MGFKQKKLPQIFFLNLLAIIFYVLLALFAKAGFSWQSSAITLWPASGLASAFVIAYGWIVLPGIAIGNFLGTAYDPSSGFNVQYFMFPIAIAASFQAGLVRFMVVRHKLLEDTLTRFSKLIKFLLWVGPLGNWPAAITFMLYKFADANSLENFYETFTSFLYWWVGDSLGSLLLLPILLLVLPLKRPVWNDRRSYLLGPMTGLIVLLFSGAFIERLLFERINITPELLEPLKGLRTLSTLVWILLTLGVLGLILQVSGKTLEQDRQLFRSRLAGDAAGAVIHEIGQPLIRLRLRLEKIVDFLSSKIAKENNAENHFLAMFKEAKLTLEELDSVVLNTRSIKDLTLAGIRDSSFADLTDAISNSVTKLRPELNRFDQDITISIEQNLPKVSTGQIQLQAVIRNLIDNSSKAAGENGVIRLTAWKDRNHVVFQIEDTGNGFNDRLVPNGQKRVNSTTGGMGLGLMIVRRVMDENHGKIIFGKSEDLSGAKITLWLTPKV